MSAFGKRGGVGNAVSSRPSFGVARPMQGGAAKRAPEPEGGDQFPPLEALEGGETQVAPPMDAMARLTSRQEASGEAGQSKVEGFEASVHRIKEQVLPRLLERVDPEAGEDAPRPLPDQDLHRAVVLFQRPDGLDVA